MICYFFFQAEDGIRDGHVTGVQTCALPIFYSHLLIEKYSKNEIESFAQSIDVKRDELFDYLGLYTFATRYLATDHDKNLFELPQERWMIIAMYLMQDEKLEYRTRSEERRVGKKRRYRRAGH